MNKKIKLLVPTLCGVLLASNLYVLNVQAASVTNTPKTNVSYRSIMELNQKYKNVGIISYDTIDKLLQYFKNNTTNSSPLDVRNILIQSGMDRALANGVSYTIYELQMETKDFSILLSKPRYGAEILEAEDGTYTLMGLNSKNETLQSYSLYGVLQPKEIKLIKDFIKSGNASDSTKLGKFLISQNIISDSTIANRLALTLFDYKKEVFDKLESFDQNILILESDDANYYNRGSYFRIAFQSR